MELLLHQTTIFVLTAMWIPLTMYNLIRSIEKSSWLHRSTVTALIITFPNIIKQYQQYIMGHFSGLPEVITTSQISADIAFMIIFLLITGLCIVVKIKVKQYEIEQRNRHGK